MSRAIRATPAAFAMVERQLREAVSGEGPSFNGQAADDITKIVYILMSVAGVWLPPGGVAGMSELIAEQFDNTPKGKLNRCYDLLAKTQRFLDRIDLDSTHKVYSVAAIAHTWCDYFQVDYMIRDNLSRRMMNMVATNLDKRCREALVRALTGLPTPTEPVALATIHNKRFTFIPVRPGDEEAAATAAAAGGALVMTTNDEGNIEVVAQGLTDALEMLSHIPGAQADQEEDPDTNQMGIIAAALGIAQSSIPVATPPEPAPGFAAFKGKGMKLVDDDEQKKVEEERKKQEMMKKQQEEDDAIYAAIVKAAEDAELEEEFMMIQMQAMRDEEEGESEDDDEEDDDPQAIFPKIRKFPKRSK